MRLIITRRISKSWEILARFDMPFDEVWVKNGNAAKKICRRVERELLVAIEGQQSISFEVEQ